MSKVNGMVWYRPTKAEMDKIETLGNPGWNWDNLEPVRGPTFQVISSLDSDSIALIQYMEAAERNIAPDVTQRAQGADVAFDVHGHNGFINTSFPVCSHQTATLLVI